MNFSLIFKNSGDVIPFSPINQEVLEFYIEQLNQQSFNNFYPDQTDKGEQILAKISSLHSSIQKANIWAYDIVGTKFDEYSTEDYLSQDILNQTHVDWAKAHLLTYDIQEKRKQSNFSGLAEELYNLYPDNEQFVLTSSILEKLGLIDQFRKINDDLHAVEESFSNVVYSVNPHKIQVALAENKHMATTLTNNIANIRLVFNHLGRTLYNKFNFFDNNLQYDDENTYDQLTGKIAISLSPPQTIPLSKEYVSWCQRHNREPVGNRLNLGNISNLYENLQQYRIIIFRNLLENNSFSIQKTKG